MPTPRKPTAILDLTGRIKKNPKRYADRADEPVDDRPLGPPPDRLDPNQRSIWVEVAGNLVDGVATAGDRDAFETLVWLIDKRRRNDINGAELSLLGALYTRFGMTPADRSRVKAPKKATNGNPFGQLA